jgi:hypothetical protein
MGMFGCFDGTILGTWLDELVFGIGVTSLLPIAVLLQHPRHRTISGRSNLCNAYLLCAKVGRE